VPAGGIIERPAPSVVPESEVRWLLHRADFNTAKRVESEINKAFGSETSPIAFAQDSGAVQVKVPPAYQGRTSVFIADLETLRVESDRTARVVVNERTGTIVIGGDVNIATVSILHGALSVEVQTEFQVSQPTPFSRGETQVVPQVNVTAAEERAQSLQLKAGATVEDLVQGLTAIGATPRDIIAILQSLRVSGALDAELEVI
jgi:flagellar P-ring protein precursor FlgI